jgi:hypothetical protein
MKSYKQSLKDKHLFVDKLLYFVYNPDPTLGTRPFEKTSLVVRQLVPAMKEL